jgi:aldose 1-epimerase
MIVTAGDLSATFLPDVGMTGVSLRRLGREHLALPGGLPALRAGATMGLPLLAPWANRLGSRRFRAAGVQVDLGGLPLSTDDNGLPIHGLLVGQPGWRIVGRSARRGRARFAASIDIDAPAFPFPHRIEISVAAQEDRLIIDTTIVPTGRRRVPVAFGWHPYLRLPGEPRSRWHLRLPARSHLALDHYGLPTGEAQSEPQEADRIGRRTFDDLYRMGRDRRLALEADDGSSITMRPGPDIRTPRCGCPLADRSPRWSRWLPPRTAWSTAPRPWSAWARRSPPASRSTSRDLERHDLTAHRDRGDDGAISGAPQSGLTGPVFPDGAKSRVSGILIRMQSSTSVRVCVGTRDAIRALAVADGVTLDEEISRLARAERQRRIGEALSVDRLDEHDRAWLDLGSHAVAHESR